MSSQHPKISIITVCLNAPNLRATCDSIVNQDCCDFEWIVIDGQSNQETLDVFEQYRDKMAFFVSEKDSGIYNAMNKGIKHARGEYLLFLNAGDWLANEHVLQKFIDGGLDADVIYANLRMMDTGTERKYPDVLDDGYWMDKTLPHQATLIRRDLFDKYGLYNEKFRIVSDYEKFIDFIYKNKCTYKHLDFMASCFDCTGISSTEKQDKERDAVIKEFFTPEQIAKHFRMNLSIWERVFSIKRFYTDNIKVMTLLGLQFKWKSK